MARDSAIALSKELEHTTGVSDEAALAAENMLLTFTNIGSDIFPDTTRAVVDMATAMNGGIIPSAEELRQQSIQLGKALQDPDAGLGALHRVGVNVDELKKKFTDSMPIQEKQKLILKELATEFGGSGKAAAQTFGGQLKMLQETFGDLMEDIGAGIAHILRPLVEWFQNFVNNFDEVTKPLQELGNQVISFFRQLWETIRPALEQLWNVITTQLGPAFQNLWQAIQPLLPYLGAMLIGAIYALVVALTIVAQVLTLVVNTVANFIRFILELPVHIQNTATTAVNWFKWLGDNWTNIIGYVIGFIATLPGKVILILIDMNVRAFNYLKSINWGQVADWFVDYWKSVPGKIYNLMVDLTNKIRSINWGDLAMSIGKGFVNSINGFIEGAVNGALSGIPGSPKIHLPRFASGVQNFAGGLAIVGERGPEVVALPRGSDVIPNNQLSSVNSSSNTTVNINVGLMTGSAIEQREAAQKIFDNLKDIASQRGQTVSQFIGAA